MQLAAAITTIYQLDALEWEGIWLPCDEDDRDLIDTPLASLLLEFPHITRRVVAQRS